ncbi:MAG: DNA polymerase III subunit gamma/tau [Patescibacteria group bacterium]|nr:DNA polymerase III subunit gamma/tau [Patescibacteria group bacterium]MDE1965760.1 DNA polymerase III subunit gamma/tau [Patescibacteria group bacterium]
MSNQSLYRAYRPQTFAEVMGQEQVTAPLAESVKTGKIGHAYLFAGSRGLGKTTVARIFAREIGCTDQDLYEIDAASQNSVENIRELAENIYTLPFHSPYKVYILDEVHMLSKSAWNAFLKTLEEPPAYAVFILATTELERVPETVQSRCQVFEFKKPTRKGIAALVSKVAEKEGYALLPDAAELIAMLSEGSYRDSLSVLQKVLGISKDKKLTREEVEAATGAPKREQVHALITALSAGERGAALSAVEKASASGADMKLFLELVIEALRATLLIRYAEEFREKLKAEHGEDEYAALLAFAKGEGVTPKTLLAFLNASERIRYAPMPEIPLELAVLELFPG